MITVPAPLTAEYVGRVREVGDGMSFFEDQEEDWYANDCKGSPSDYYAGELAPWLDDFTDTSKPQEAIPVRARSKSKKRREQKKRAEARKKAEAQEKVNAHANPDQYHCD